MAKTTKNKKSAVVCHDDQTAYYEQCLLAALFADPSQVASLGIKSRHFVDDVHQILFETLIALQEEGTPIDEVLVKAKLKLENQTFANQTAWDRIGGAAYLAQIFNESFQAANVKYYAALVKESANKRDLVALSLEIPNALAAGESAEEVRNRIQEAVERQRQSSERKSLYNIITSVELANGDFTIDYIIDGILVDGQPTEICAPFKAMKTGIAVDLGISVASGEPFLNHFKVNTKKIVLIMSAESGMATLKAKAKEICTDRGIELASLAKNLLWSDSVPLLAKVEHLAEMETVIKRLNVGVLIVDPTYLAISGENMSNLSDQGAQLREFAMLCQRLGVTLLLIHHTKKNIPPGEPLELADIQGAGHAEFVRQWILINRREKYDTLTGIHKLWINYGGSAGHCGLFGCDIAEGVFNPDAAWRKWKVEIHSPDKVRLDMAKQLAAVKQSAKQTTAAADHEKTLEEFRKAFRSNQNEWLTASGLESLSGIGRKTEPFKRTLAEGLRTGKFEQQERKAKNNKMEIHYRAIWDDSKTVDSGRLQRNQCQENLPLSTAEDGTLKKCQSSTAATSVEGESSTVNPESRNEA